jgi:putative membrane protein insertion efficiency factor
MFKTITQKILVFFIRLYQILISPLIGGQCRFYPSCSNYAIEAIEKKGIIKGFFLSLWRILRCGPWSEGGNDPVK